MASAGDGKGNGLIGILPVGFAAALFVFFASQIGAVSGLGPQKVELAWVPSLDVQIAFILDGLSLIFALLISGIGTLVMLYSNTYLAGHPQYGRFALYLTLFMLAMLGLVVSDNLLTLFVFWELTTVTSFLLIGFGHESAKSRRSALQAMLLTGAGALALLAGLILLGAVAGTYSISGIIASGDVVRDHPLYGVIVILILAGALTKSAQVPFHFWLPNAMAAPTPVSAFLHSATMVKAGVFLMARLHPSLSGTDLWMWTLTTLGAVTAVFASILALRQTDLKQALAYTTLMALGTLTLFLGSDTEYAITAFCTFLIVHSLYKAALFLVVGCIDHSTGTREAGLLGGLARAMPVTALAAAVAALSMAGFPPFLGFIGKELKYAGALAVASEPVLVALAVLAANALMLAVAGVVAFGPFWRRAGGTMPKTPHEAPWQMLAGPVILAALGAVLGINPELIQTTLINPGVDSILRAGGEAKELKLWAGVNMPLILSIATFVLGLTLYALHKRLRAILIRWDEAAPHFDAGWDRLLDGLKALAAWQTRLLQSGILRQYLLTIFGALFVTLAYTLWARSPGVPALSFPDLELKHWAIIALIAAGTIEAALTGSRIAAVAALGVVGIGVALIFVIYGAPDVAITQLLVETLVVVLISVVMLRLPLLDEQGRRDWRPRDAALGLGVGIAVTVIMLQVLAQPLDTRLTDYFEVTSWPEAFGRNIVNVILVDFRALDTFGEIAVVLIAALSAYALLRTTKEEVEK